MNRGIDSVVGQDSNLHKTILVLFGWLLMSLYSGHLNEIMYLSPNVFLFFIIEKKQNKLPTHFMIISDNITLKI